eukprot:gene1647-3186_t
MLPKKDRKLDFQALTKASELVISQLHFDENIPDLRDQFNQSAGIDGNHQYFIEPYMSTDPQLSAWLPMFEYKSFIPFPPKIFEQRRLVECTSFMGILPEINRAWITVDNRLYLWNISHPDDYILYESLNDVIVSVALTTPKLGIFTDQVKYLLVVATPSSVHILALIWDKDPNDLRIQNTKYIISSDNITILKIIGNRTGRIFLAGDDSNLYEFLYENNQDSWTAYLGIEAPFKCRKLRHGGQKLITVLVPSFVWGLVGAEESLVELVVDDVLNVLYTVSSSGSLGVFYLGTNGNETHQIIPSFSSLFNFNIFSATREYLFYANARGGPDASLFQEPHGMKVISAHIIPRTESESVHLAIVLSTGIRVYFSIKTNEGYALNVNTRSGFPAEIVVVHVRAPPPISLLDKLKSGERSVPGESFTPANMSPNTILNVNSAFYFQGVYLNAFGRNDDPDTILGIAEDLVSRRGEVDHSLLIPQPALRENVCIISPPMGRMEGKIYDMREVNPVVNKDMSLAHLRTLFTCSRTPKDFSTSLHVNPPNDIGIVSSMSTSMSMSPTCELSDVIPGPPAAAPAGTSTSPIGSSGGSGCGITRGDLASLAVLGELCYENGPSYSYIQRKFLCLAGNGVHIITKRRPIDLLYRILSMHGTGDEFALHAQTVLHRFGALQFCAMCVAIGSGVPVDAGGSGSGLGSSCSITTPPAVPDLVRRRAILLMLKICGQPSFKNGYQPFQGTGLSTSTTQMDSRAVFGARFVFSSAHDGISLFLSRLLRPMWFRIIVHLITSPPLEGKQRPQARILFNRNEITALRQPLLRLYAIFRDFFASAVSRELRPPTDSTSSSSLSSTSTGGGLNTNLQDTTSTADMTHGSSYNMQLLASRVTPQHDPQQEARRIEESSLNLLYRLTSRCIQLLSLVDILLETEKDFAVPVNWDKIAGLTYQSLVTSLSSHDSIRMVITDLLNLPTAILSPATADIIMSQLCTHCYLFFSAGDRFAYEASTVLAMAQNAPRNSPERDTNVAIAVSLFLQAARYWTSPSNVIGENADLWMTCRKLLHMGPIGRDGIVDICIVATQNFGAMKSGWLAIHNGGGGSPQAMPRTSSLSTSTTLDGSTSSSTSPHAWEKGLYHGGSATDEEESLQARREVYICLLHELKALTTSQQRLGAGIVSSSHGYGHGLSEEEVNAASQRMVHRALESCLDEELHRIIYTDLLETDTDLLLSVRSPLLEDFLRNVKPTLLYNYFERHGLHGRACVLAEELARMESSYSSSSPVMTLDQRIEYLIRAVHSASQITDNSPDVGVFVGYFPSEKMLELQGALELAGLQQQLYGTLSQELHTVKNSTSSTSSSSTTGTATSTTLSEAGKRSLQILEDVVDCLGKGLVDINYLYNKAAFPYKQWDICLCALGLAEEGDAATIVQLWRSLIYRVVPLTARSQEIQSMLQDRRRSLNLLEDRRRQRQNLSFEDIEWTNDIRDLVVTLGSRLCRERGIDLSTVFPVPLILEELEELSCMLLRAGVQSMRGWPAKCLRMVPGVSYSVLVDTYYELNRRGMGRKGDKVLQMLWNASKVLEEWVGDTALLSSTTIGFSMDNTDGGGVRESRVAIQQAIRMGRMRDWLDAFQHTLSTYSAHSLNATDRSLLSEIKSSLDVVDRLSRSLALA